MMDKPQRERSASAPKHDGERGGVALLIIDMINCFDFDGAEALKPMATAAAATILRLRRQIEAAGWPVIYVNDNFGEWHSEKSKLVERALAKDQEITPLLRPDDSDYFIIKPQFSGFYATNLPVLLPKLGVSRLILTGVQTDICVLFTAADAHMRDYALWVPSDAVAAEDDARSHWALSIMRESMGANTESTATLNVGDWVGGLDTAAVD